MANTSKNKGSSWEREIAKFLTELYGESFLRVFGSGAFVGGSNRTRISKLDEHQTKGHKGDITPPDDWMYWNAEAKNYGEFKFHQMLTDKANPLDSWISQMKEVEKPGDLNIIFIKITRRGKFVMVPNNYNWNLGNVSHISYQSKLHGNWIMFDFDLFWDHNKDLVKSICKG